MFSWGRDQESKLLKDGWISFFSYLPLFHRVFFDETIDLIPELITNIFLSYVFKF